MKLVKLPTFTGTHVDFQTWWFQFQPFTTVWKFAAERGKASEVDLPVSKTASLSMTAEVGDRQKVAKKQNVITFVNLTTALDSPSLIGMLMQPQTADWPSGLASMVMKQLFDKLKPQDTVSLIDMNRFKQHIGLQTPDSNPESLFEQMAALENQFKKRMDNSEKITFAIVASQVPTCADHRNAKRRGNANDPTH